MLEVMSILLEVNRIHAKLFQFSSGPRGPMLEQNSQFLEHKVKLQYHMFSSMKIQEYMGSELFDIFRVKLVAKNVTELSLQCDVSL